MGITSIADEGIEGGAKGVTIGVFDLYREHIVNTVALNPDDADVLTDDFYTNAVRATSPLHKTRTRSEVPATASTHDSWIIHLRQDHKQDKS